MEENFTQKDIELITNRGNSLEKLKQQLQFFKDGINKMNLVKSASKGDGIWVFDANEKQDFINYFDKHKGKYSIEKFVPASGAASRMFKFLSEFINEFDPENDSINSYINHKTSKDLSVFLVGLRNFPFYKNLKEKTIELYPNYNDLEKDYRDYLMIKTLLSKDHFNFANKPKAFFRFTKSTKSTTRLLKSTFLNPNFIVIRIKKRKFILPFQKNIKANLRK